MPRTKKQFEDRRQQIIDGALEVFASKGFEKATNKDIAKAAGIGSPGLIYHYFKDKWDLFQQIVTERTPVIQLLQESESLMDQPPDQVLAHFARTILDTTTNPVTLSLVRLMLGEAMRRPQLAQLVYNTVSSRVLSFIERYLAHQMERGTLRPVDPRAAARTFMGPLLAYIFIHDLFQLSDPQDLSRETMATTTVDIFLQGLQSEA